jgi:hypothetical protein
MEVIRTPSQDRAILDELCERHAEAEFVIERYKTGQPSLRTVAGKWVATCSKEFAECLASAPSMIRLIRRQHQMLKKARDALASTATQHPTIAEFLAEFDEELF